MTLKSNPSEVDERPANRVGELGDAAPGAAADVILDDSDDQGWRKAFRRRSFFIKIPLRLLLMATVLTSCCLTFVGAQTATVIPANLAAGHVNQYATVEGVVAKVFTSKSENTFVNIGASYPNQTFTGWVPPASPVLKSAVLASRTSRAITSRSPVALRCIR